MKKSSNLLKFIWAVGIALFITLHASAVKADSYVSTYGLFALVARLDGTTGTQNKTFASGLNPTGLSFGPDGTLYVGVAGYGIPIAGYGSGVQRYDRNGTPLDTDSSGQAINFVDLSSSVVIKDMAFGPDGFLYVAATGIPGPLLTSINGVLKINLTSRSYQLFMQWTPVPKYMRFGPDGNLYQVLTGCGAGNQYCVGRINMKTGAVNTFISSFGGSPKGLSFGPDGNLYVIDNIDVALLIRAQVERYEAGTGKLKDVFIPANAAVNGGLGQAADLAFGPDPQNPAKNNLYVLANSDSTSLNAAKIMRYDATQGTFLGVFGQVSGLVSFPYRLILSPSIKRRRGQLTSQ